MVIGFKIYVKNNVILGDLKVVEQLKLHVMKIESQIYIKYHQLKL